MAIGKKKKSSSAAEERDVDFLNGGDAGEVEESEESEELEVAAEIGEDVLTELSEAREEASENKDKYLRALAEFENFKKRSIKERSEMLKYEGSKVIADLLEVLDNLELAVEHSGADPEKLKDGLSMIHKQFVDALGKWQVRSKSGLGNTFDPEIQSAISKVPATDGNKPGTVISELKKTYFYKDRLLRPGEVVVAVEPENE